jgi:hypothetical protein
MDKKLDKKKLKELKDKKAKQVENKELIKK